jgi:HSP20 family protein
MSIIRRSSPFGELLSLRQAMDRLFEESFIRPRGLLPDEGFAMPLDVYSTPDALVVEAALPGVKPEDVEISVLGETLTLTAISSSEQRAEESGYLFQEVRRGHFSRTVSLPTSLKPDAATATFEHGMLRLSIPKAEAARPRQIRITPTTEAGPLTTGSGDAPAGPSREHADSSPATAESASDASNG